MKKLLVFSLTCASALMASGYNGYTYFSVGMENISYSEAMTTSKGSLKLEAQGNSPVYISGGLMRVNDTFDFSMDISSTLLPSQINETWSLNGAVEQNNHLDAMINSMQFLGHYKLTDNHRLVLGPTYSLNSYKRYNFKDANPSGGEVIDETDGILLEERVATLYATLGYWYESIPHATPEKFRIKFSALYGQPIWNDASNTGFEGVSFSSLSGYKIDTNLYVGYPIMDGLELGIFTGYRNQSKIGTDRTTNSAGKGVSWPENTLEIWQAGISAVWNFAKK
jgi:hypothetical protein